MKQSLDIPSELELLIFDQKLDFSNLQGQLIHIYGEAGTGKTTLALQIATSFCKNDKKVFLLDTEGKITGTKIKNLVGDLYFQQVNNNLKLIALRKFAEQQKFIERLDYFFLKQKADLIIVDTITNHYRQSMIFQEDAKKLYEQLAYQIAFLSKVSRERNLPILLFNQATMPKREEKENKQENYLPERINPVARAIMKYWSTKEIILIKHGWGNFEARIPGEVKRKVKFSLDSSGIIINSK